jgi:hypothetical protein
MKIKKPLYGGKIISWVTFSGGKNTLVTFRPNTFSIEKKMQNGEIIEETLDVQKDTRVNVLGIHKANIKKIDLQEADFIICGGRGMKGPENFPALEEIADIMGGFGKTMTTRSVKAARLYLQSSTLAAAYQAPSIIQWEWIRRRLSLQSTRTPTRLYSSMPITAS